MLIYVKSFLQILRKHWIWSDCLFFGDVWEGEGALGMCKVNRNKFGFSSFPAGGPVAFQE